MEDHELKTRLWASAVEFQRLFGRHSPGATLHEFDGVVASVVPSSPASLVNAAIPTKLNPEPLPLAEIARAYKDAGVPKWAIWLDSEDTANAQAVERAGLVLDSNPVLMAAPLDDIPGLEDAPHDSPVDLATVGRVNDLAYQHAEPRLAPMVEGFRDDAIHAHAATYEGEPACVTLVLDVGRDAFVTFVATLPKAQRRGLAGGLLRQALHQARQRGCTTTSLQASQKGRGVYERLGYRPLGEQHLWEKRP